MKAVYLFLVSIGLTMFNPLNAQHLESTHFIFNDHKNKLLLQQENGVDYDDLFDDDHHYTPFVNYRMRNDLITAVVDTYSYYTVINGVSRIFSETVPVYNEENVMTAFIRKQYDYDTGFFGYYNNVRFKYDDQGRVVEDTVYIYNRSTQKWILRELITDVYNEKDQLDTLKIYIWDNASKQWKGDQYTVFNYNEKDQITSITVFKWDPTIQSYGKISETIIEFDEQFRQIKQTNFRIIGVLLQIGFELHTAYSPDGDQSVNTSYIRTISNGPLNPFQQVFSRFNEGGTILFTETYQFNGFMNNVPIWIPSSKKEFAYDENNFEIENRTLQWNSALNRYDLDEVTGLKYDEYGNMIHSETFNVNNSGETNLISEQTVELEYNFDKNEIVYPYPSLNSYSHKIKDRINYNHASQRIDNRWQFIWKVLTTSSTDETIPSSDIKIFPNPVMDVLIIQAGKLQGQYDHVTITDMYGRLIYRNTYSGELRLPVHNWSSGNYIAIFSNSQHGRVESHRFIKM